MFGCRAIRFEEVNLGTERMAFGDVLIPVLCKNPADAILPCFQGFLVACAVHETADFTLSPAGHGPVEWRNPDESNSSLPPSRSTADARSLSPQRPSEVPGLRALPPTAVPT